MIRDEDIRIGQYVTILPEDSDSPEPDVRDIGTVETWDGGWYVRLLITGELTGPWQIWELRAPKPIGEENGHE